MIDRAALAALPANGPLFLQRHETLIAQTSVMPDQWRGSDEPYSRIAEDPNHGWFREQFAFLDPVPRSRTAFILALFKHRALLPESDVAGRERLNLRWTGTLPYALTEGYEREVVCMRGLRALMAAKSTARPEIEAKEQQCAVLAAWFSHYVADGSQPLHVSVQHDGWVGVNPEHYTRAPSIHALFETKYVNAIALSPMDIEHHMQPVARQSGAVFDLTLAYLERSRRYVDSVYRLEKEGAFADPTNAAARVLVYERTAAAADYFRDLLVRAWLESAAPSGPTGPSTIDPASPGYNQETGTVSP